MSLENKIKEVLEKIETARKSSPFNQKVDLIAATKTRDISQIQNCYKLGVLNIGENRIQEAEKKFVEFPGFNQLKKRFIGHLQTNKVNKLCCRSSYNPCSFFNGKKSWNQLQGSDSFNPDFNNNTLVVDLWTSGFRAAT